MQLDWLTTLGASLAAAGYGFPFGLGGMMPERPKPICPVCGEAYGFRSQNSYPPFQVRYCHYDVDEPDSPNYCVAP